MQRLLCLILVLSVAFSCVEEPPEPAIIDQPAVIVSYSLFGSHSARFEGVVGKTERVFTSGGFIYGLSPDYSDAKKSPGLILNHDISATVSDLKPGTTYYLKAFVTDRYGTVESNDLSFETSSFSVVQKEFDLPFEGGSVDLSVLCLEDFCIDTRGTDWISPVTTKTNFIHSQTILIAPNESLLAREATITLSSPDGFFKEAVSIKQAGAPVPIEDPVLKTYLLGLYDLDNSGGIELNEIPAVTTIDIQSADIISLKGIEFFPNLQELICKGLSGKDGGLEEVDVSNNPRLELIDVSHNQISFIDISECPLLKSFDCSFNRLTSLDVSANEPLERLVCNSNGLSTLHLENNVSLLTVNCDDNAITTLHSSRSDALTELSCSHNEIEELDLSNNKNLLSVLCADNKLVDLKIVSKRLALLDCSSNLLKSLPVRKFESLVTLRCADNHFSDLDLRHNVNLSYLDCSINGISSLDLSNAKALRFLDCHGNPLSTLDITSLVNLQELYCNCPSMTTLFIEGSQEIEGISVNRSQQHVNDKTVIRSHGGLAVIQDPVFKQHLVQYHDADQDGEISLDEAITITSLNICTDQIQSLSGIEYLTGLKYLKCEGSEDAQGNAMGQLTSLDLSSNVQLEQLLCCRNRLEALDVSQNVNLRTLWCFKNQLTKLDLSNNPQICDLSCERNLITTLDLTLNPELSSLDCSPMCGEDGRNLLASVYLCGQRIDYVNGKEHRRNVSNIPPQTAIYFNGSSLGFLPGGYMFNYNARFFDAPSRTFFNGPDALWQHEMVLNGNGYTVGDGFVHIQRGTFSQWDFGSMSENPFNRTASNGDLTIIVKAKGDSKGDFSLFANRSDYSDYNYMFREGDESTLYFYLHDARSQGSANYIRVQTLPNIVVVRAQDGKVWLESNTDHIKGAVMQTSWGSPSKSISFFYGGISGEYWEGDFYWMFLSLEALTDEEIEAVVQYNEN